MKLSRIDSEKVRAEATPAAASSVEPQSQTALCAPGCNCPTPSGSRKMKAGVSLIVLLAVAAIFAYKMSSAKQDASNNIAAKGGSAFAVAQAAPNAMPGVEDQSSSVAVENKTAESAVPQDKPTVENATAPESAKRGEKIGEYLASLGELNKVALNQDAVFVYIPAKNNEPVSSKTNDAVLAAQKALKSNKITLGLYTLSTSSPDYSGISAQVQSPAILVAIKGKGMAAVSGDVTETKLLQAFTASSRAGGCGPSGCGPSGAGCK